MKQEEFRKITKKSRQKGYRMLFDEYCNYVYAIVFNRLRSCASREDIDECVGDVFSDVYRYFDSDGSFEGDMSGFIGTVARRKSSYYYNRLASGNDSLPLDDEEVQAVRSGDDVENEVSQNEFQHLLIEKIAELGEPDFTIIIQKYYYNRTSSEIARIVSMTPEAVRMRCGRALKKLKTILENSGITL